MKSSTRPTCEHHQKIASRLHEKQIFKVCHFLRKQQITEIITKKHVRKLCQILVDWGITLWSILGAFLDDYLIILGNKNKMMSWKGPMTLQEAEEAVSRGREGLNPHRRG